MKHVIHFGCSWLLTQLIGVPPVHGQPPATPKPMAQETPGASSARGPAKARGTSNASNASGRSRPKGESRPKSLNKPKSAPDASGSTSDPKSDVSKLATAIQEYYDRIEDYTADFIQSYTRVALSRTSESRGRLMLKKPGMMRWEYEKPAQKLWVSDGRQLFVYDVEENQVFIDRDFEAARLRSSVSFLWGTGKLTDSFVVSMANAADYGGAKNAKALELVPREDATYARLILITAPDSAEVTESILFETSGNKNHFKFLNAKINTGLLPDTFRYTPPPGAEVIHRGP